MTSIKNFYFYDQSGTLPLFSSNESWVTTCLKVASFPFIFFANLINNFLNKEIFEWAARRESGPYNQKMLEMSHHIHSTDQYVTEEHTRIFFPLLGLSECACAAFHRFKNIRRVNLENAVVDRLIKIQPDKTAPVQLLSMGSGGLLSDFIILEKLALKGFKNISIDFVEPSEIPPKIIEEIKRFFQEVPLSLSISTYNAINELPQEKRNYCAILAIDYDGLHHSTKYRGDALADLIEARKRLSDHGFLALGFAGEDTLSGKTMTTHILTSEPCGTQNLIADLTQYFQKKDQLRVAVPDTRLEGVSLLLYALVFISEKFPNCKVSISCLSDDQEEQEFRTMLQSAFPRANVTMTEHNKDQKYDLFLTGSLRKDCTPEKCSSLLSENALCYISYPRGAIHRMTNDKEWVIICNSY